MSNTRYYRHLNAEEKDEVIELLLDHLSIEIYNPYEYGPEGVGIEITRDKETKISNKQEEKMDELVNELTDGVTYSYEELDYIYKQLGELKNRGHF